MNKTTRYAFVGLIINIAFAVYHIVFGIISYSWWLFTVGIYYAVLSTVRFVVIQSKKNGSFLIKFTGIMLMLLSAPLVGTVILSVIRDRGIVIHEIAMIGMATYSFAKITLAIINIIKVRKVSSAKLVTLRSIALSDACVSIFALQRSMLVSFGNMPQTDIRIFNAVIGSVVCIIVFLLGLKAISMSKGANDF